MIIIGILLLNIALLYSQETDINLLQQQEQQLSTQIELLQIEKTKLLHQSDSLAVLIQQLKSNQDMNIFQRRRLEQLLKSSQEFNQKISEIDQSMAKLDREHQTILGELILWYDGQIAKMIDSAQGKKLSQAQVEQLASDSYQTMKQKADLLKDQEDKARKQIKLVDKRVKELQSELKLRNRMNELIADTYLMNQPTEKLLPQNQARGANENASYAGTDKSTTQSSASFDAVDNLLLKADLSGISNLDLESQVRNLQQMKVRLNQSADSLRIVADQFYQAAEKKRQDDNKK